MNFKEDIETSEREETCPNCGQFAGTASVCPNCGAVLFNEDDDLNPFDEEDSDSPEF